MNKNEHGEKLRECAECPGKGDTPRSVNKAKYDANWDLIDWFTIHPGAFPLNPTPNQRAEQEKDRIHQDDKENAKKNEKAGVSPENEGA